MNVHEKYRLGPRLGAGGMADVFRAELTGAEGFSRPVAIKRLHAGVSSDPAFSAMFVREARVLSALHHPGIVSVLDFDRDADGRLFLVMELVDGVTLSQLVQRGPLPPAVAGHVMAEVLLGLGHAHARGVLHRDVTPHNVLLGWNGEVKLGDFGLAEASASSRVSDGGLIRGKVPYLSPEQLQGLAIDARSDLFSVGVMSYQLMTGRYPFIGRTDQATDQATVAESIARMLTATIVPPRDLRPEIPAALSDVVMRLLERERERRFLSADMVLAEMPAQERGRELLVDLLVERFPGRVVTMSAGGAGGLAGERAGDLASADTWPAAGEQAGLAGGQAPDPWFRRHTATLPGVRPGQKNAQENDQASGRQASGRQASGRRWWPGLALALVALPLVWVVHMQWPRGGAPGATAAAGGLGQASSPAGLSGQTEAAGGARLPTTDLPRTAAVTPVAAEAGRGAVAAVPSFDRSGARSGGRSGRSAGDAAGDEIDHAAGDMGADAPRDAPGDTIDHAAAGAGRAPPRRTQPRARAAAAVASTDTSTRAAETAPPAPEPVQTPAVQRYEQGWTEVTPQQTLTGEVPIRRERP